MPISRSARTMRTQISPRLAISTFPNTRTSPPTWSGTTGSLPASSQAPPRAPEGRRAATGYASGKGGIQDPLHKVTPGRPRSPRLPPELGKVRSSKWDVSVLAWRSVGSLGPDHLQSLDEVRSRLARVYHVVYKAHLRGYHRVVELLLVVGDQLFAFRIGVFGLRDLASEDDTDSGGRAHDRDLTRRPRDVDVGPDVLGAHNVVGPAIRFPGDDRHLGHRGLGEGVEELRPVPDDASPLLVRAWHEPRHVHERDERYVERVAEAHEPRALHARVYVQRPRQHGRLIPYDA